MEEQPNKFHLGICMAGAVTAGSYTAGVLDYILESLERWQQQKDANNLALKKGQELPFPDTPMYDVVIDVITGASAGGMCAAIATSMLVEGINIEDLASYKSKLYQSWIELDDDEESDTINKMLETDDLQKEGFTSLLNTKVISNLFERAIQPVPIQKKLPPYVDDNLDTIFTLSNLRGKKYSIDFKSYGTIKRHKMTLHKDFMHFKLNQTAKEDSDFLELKFTDPDNLKLFRESAIASGAFPIGLRSQELKRSMVYYNNKANSIVGLKNLITRGLTIEPLSIEPEDYESLNIDGGAFDNEPFGETEKVLNRKANMNSDEDFEFNKTNRTILMIDPFPSVEEEEKKYKIKPKVLEIIPQIINALRSQSSFKREDLIDSLSDDNFTKFLIVPSKSGTSEPLCCASLGAFSGLLHKEFRLHDYKLGRRNAQQFLRKHFVMPYNQNEGKNNLIHRGWTVKARAKFLTEENDLPIIPDYQESVLPRPELEEEYPLDKLKELVKPIEQRVKAILYEMEKIAEKDTTKKEPKVVEEWFKEKPVTRILNSTKSFLGKPFIWLISWRMKKKIQRIMVEGIIKVILTDLGKAGLLKENVHKNSKIELLNFRSR